MSKFANLSPDERAIYLNELASRRGISPVIAEKDFWVVWVLAHLFSLPMLREQLVFKGGTSLSKVFGVIDRFSEDVDLSLNPQLLGFQDVELETASNSKRQRLMRELESKCIAIVEQQIMPEIESRFQRDLGAPGAPWLKFSVDGSTHSPVVHFQYPQAIAAGGSYIRKEVKIEFGSLTDQRPTDTHQITAMAAELKTGSFEDLTAEVVALEVERTFWEKATILHAEYFRSPDSAMRDRFSRHFSDFAALWQHLGGQRVKESIDLLHRVTLHKSRFFASGWARYDLACPGTLRLLPQDHRLAELKADYEKMADMFLTQPVPLDEILSVIREAEMEINR